MIGTISKEVNAQKAIIPIKHWVTNYGMFNLQTRYDGERELLAMGPKSPCIIPSPSR
jgi:hypothetical protein